MPIGGKGGACFWGIGVLKARDHGGIRWGPRDRPHACLRKPEELRWARRVSAPGGVRCPRNDLDGPHLQHQDSIGLFGGQLLRIRA